MMQVMALKFMFYFLRPYQRNSIGKEENQDAEKMVDLALKNTSKMHFRTLLHDTNRIHQVHHKIYTRFVFGIVKLL